MPKQWRTGIISSLYKKRDRKAVENYRGVILLKTAYKIYAMILNERIKKRD